MWDLSLFICIKMVKPNRTREAQPWEWSLLACCGQCGRAVTSKTWPSANIVSFLPYHARVGNSSPVLDSKLTLLYRPLFFSQHSSVVFTRAHITALARVNRPPDLMKSMVGVTTSTKTYAPPLFFFFFFFLVLLNTVIRLSYYRNTNNQ